MINYILFSNHPYIVQTTEFIWKIEKLQGNRDKGK